MFHMQAALFVSAFQELAFGLYRHVLQPILYPWNQDKVKVRVVMFIALCLYYQFPPPFQVI